MSKQFISDAEMQALESSDSQNVESTDSPSFISDEDMVKMENSEYRDAHANDGFIDKIKDPKRWQAVLNNTGPYKAEVVEDSVPMVAPASALPKLAKVASTLANGQGIGYALGRTALSAGQGAAISALDSKEGESSWDKLERAKSGAKLSGGIQAAVEAIPVVGKFIGAGARKIGSAISGVDENILTNYSKRTDEVNTILKESGGDMTAAADQVRTELSNGIQKTKSSINKKISDTLSKSANVSKIDETPIIEALNSAKSKLNPNFDSSSIKEIDDMISTIMAEAKSGRADGGLTADGLYQAKKFLNDASSSSYTKDGAIFTRSNAAARAAKDAASKAREAIKKYVPEISDADAQLSRLHQIERRLNKNILAAGKPDGALFAAGSGANQRNAATLKELENISGVPVSQRALDLATAKNFAKPSLTPSDATGKVMGRMALAAGIGGAAGMASGDPISGAAIGGAVASPFAMKGLINAANVGGKIIQKVPSGTVLNAVAQKGAAINRKFERQKESIAQPNRTPAINSNPPKGYDKWARKGLEKIGVESEKGEELLKSKEARKLLIEASDLPPDSKRLKMIKQQLQGMEK